LGGGSAISAVSSRSVASYGLDQLRGRSRNIYANEKCDAQDEGMPVASQI